MPDLFLKGALSGLRKISWPGLPDKPFKPFHFPFEWRVFQVRIDECIAAHHRFGVREPSEGKFSVIGADAAVTDAAEWQMGVGEMPIGIVDTAPSEWEDADPFPLQVPVGGEKIKRQRVRMEPYQGQGL